MNDREQTAIHEAAHVVIAEQLRPRLIKMVSIIPDDHDEGHFLYDETVLADATNFEVALVLAAGPVAEALFSPPASVDCVDLDNLRHLPWRLDAVRKAADLLEASQDAVFRVAGALLVHDELEGGQLRGVLE